MIFIGSIEELQLHPLGIIMETKKIILYFSSTIHGYTHAVELSLIPLLLLIQSAETGFDLSWRDTFLFAAASIFLFGFGGLPSGYFADKYGSLKIILCGLIISILSAVGLFFCTNSIQFLVLISLLGLGSSFYHPSGLSLISKFYPDKKGKPMGTHGFVGIFGQIAGPLVAGLMGAIYGWRSVYLFWAIIGLVLVYFNIILILKRYEMDLKPKQTSSKIEISKLDKKFLFQSIIILVLFLTIFRGWLYRGTVQVLPFYIEYLTADMSVGAIAALSGFYITLIYLAGSIGQLTGGYLSDKYGHKRPLLLMSILSLISLFFIIKIWFAYSITIFGFELPLNSLALGIIIFGFAFFGGQPIVNALIGDITPERIRGTFFGFTFLTRFGLSSVSLILIAVLASEFILIAFYLVLVFAIFTIFIVLAIEKTYLD
jgi:MFS family permease